MSLYPRILKDCDRRVGARCRCRVEADGQKQRWDARCWRVRSCEAADFDCPRHGTPADDLVVGVRAMVIALGAPRSCCTLLVARLVRWVGTRAHTAYLSTAYSILVSLVILASSGARQGITLSLQGSHRSAASLCRHDSHFEQSAVEFTRARPLLSARSR